MSGEKVIARGTVATCPNCHKSIAIAKEDVITVGKIRVGEWEPLDKSVKSGGEMICSECGTYYFRKPGQIHTRAGWQG